jgi:competence protein ComFC
LIKKLLIRKIDTIPQTKMDRDERLNNMTNVFAFIEPDIDLQSYRIVLVDDVITTGATISSAHKILKENLPSGTEILCLALAH